MRRNHAIRTAALALAAAAALPTLALASGGGGNSGNPQEQARIERLIEQAIRGDSDADRQEQARIDRLVQQALQRAGGPAIRSQQAVRPAEMAEAGRAPLNRAGSPGR